MSKIKLYLLFVSAFMMNHAHATAKSSAEYWKETGLTINEIKETFSNEVCLKSVKNFNSCLMGLNVAISDEKGEVLVLTKKLKGVVGQNNFNVIYEKDDLTVVRIKDADITQINQASYIDSRKRSFAAKRKLFNEVKRNYTQATIVKVKADINLLVETLWVDDNNDLVKSVNALNEFYAGQMKDHTRLATIAENNIDMTVSDESFYGIGVGISKVPSGIMINNIINGGPSSYSDLKRTDILKGYVNDENEIVLFSKMSLSESVEEHIKGKLGKVFNAVVARPGVKEDLLIPITRGKVVLKNVTSEVLYNDDINNDGKKDMTGYIKLESFMKFNSASEIKKAILALEKKGVNSLILDLRGNGGGLVSQSVSIASLFIPINSVVVQTYDLEEKVMQEPLKTSSRPITDLPLVVMLDGNSASASELLTGALLDYDRATTVGVRSFGKGTVQGGSDINDKIMMYNTIARFHRPSGSSNQLVGIQPQFLIEDKENINFIRELDISINPVEAANNILQEKRDLNLESCVHKNGNAEEEYNDQSIVKSYDIQLMHAKDIASCKAI